MTAEAVIAASMAFKKALIDLCLGVEFGYHHGSSFRPPKPQEASSQRGGRSGKTVRTDDGPLRDVTRGGASMRRCAPAGRCHPLHCGGGRQSSAFRSPRSPRTGSSSPPARSQRGPLPPRNGKGPMKGLSVCGLRVRVSGPRTPAPVMPSCQEARRPSTCRGALEVGIAPSGRPRSARRWR